MFGVDVLLLQTETDIEEELEKRNLSAKFVLGGFQKISIPKYSPEIYKEEKAVSNVTRQRSPVTLDMNTVRKRPSARKTQNMQTRETKGHEMEFEELAQLASSIVMITIHDHRGEAIGSGSGIMIGRDGYILTNNHVAAGGKFYSVRIEDDDLIYKTDEVIKYNPVLDLAVIRIDRRLNPLSVYRGEKRLVRGQKVVAIGSPLGLFNSVSDGIISGFRRIDDVDMIQFTAPTSHGSSGGAVLNMMGEVIGISTAGIDNGQNLNLAVGYENIWGFIKGFT
ncbi:MAG: serine protease [Lachnospiraceae bacterium]|nr:serine protease [Lachnospiraceae bacterium]